MENLIINRTQSTPRVIFNKNGNLLIEGRSFCEDPLNFYGIIFSWCSRLKATDVILEINLDYLNTSSSKCLYELVRILDENIKLKKVDIRWFYDSDDDEMFETGQMLEDNTSRIKFEYLSVESISSCIL